MLFSRKIPFHNAARLTRRSVLFATIYHHPPLFTAVRTIHFTWSHFFKVTWCPSQAGLHSALHAFFLSKFTDEMKKNVIYTLKNACDCPCNACMFHDVNRCSHWLRSTNLGIVNKTQFPRLCIPIMCEIAQFGPECIIRLIYWFIDLFI